MLPANMIRSFIKMLLLNLDYAILQVIYCKYQKKFNLKYRIISKHHTICDINDLIQLHNRFLHNALSFRRSVISLSYNHAVPHVVVRIDLRPHYYLHTNNDVFRLCFQYAV